MDNLRSIFNKRLGHLYPQGELDALYRTTMLHVRNCSLVQLLMCQGSALSASEATEMERILHGLEQEEPIQYLIGYVDFRNTKLHVNPNVLIPRPETSELVDLLLSENPQEQNIRLLDIGTGSGCIAISIAQERPSYRVSAIDISASALQTATQNANDNGASVNFMQADILNMPESDEVYDIIVSNPPYIRQSEQSNMSRNVLDNEPHIALFVDDNDPLLFYRAIAQYGQSHLSTSGKLYFEINEALGKETSEMLSSLDYTNIRVVRDGFGKERMITCARN